MCAIQKVERLLQTFSFSARTILSVTRHLDSKIGVAPPCIYIEGRHGKKWSKNAILVRTLGTMDGRGTVYRNSSNANRDASTRDTTNGLLLFGRLNGTNHGYISQLARIHMCKFSLAIQRETIEKDNFLEASHCCSQRGKGRCLLFWAGSWVDGCIRRTLGSSSIVASHRLNVQASFLSGLQVDALSPSSGRMDWLGCYWQFRVTLSFIRESLDLCSSEGKMRPSTAMRKYSNSFWCRRLARTRTKTTWIALLYPSMNVLSRPYGVAQCHSHYHEEEKGQHFLFRIDKKLVGCSKWAERRPRAIHSALDSWPCIVFFIWEDDFGSLQPIRFFFVVWVSGVLVLGSRGSIWKNVPVSSLFLATMRQNLPALEVAIEQREVCQCNPCVPVM